MRYLLSEEEIRAKNAYGFTPEIDSIVEKTWLQLEDQCKPDTPINLFHICLFRVGTILLYLDFFKPGIKILQATVALIVTLYWVLIPIIVLTSLILVVMTKKNQAGTLVFGKDPLDLWHKKAGLITSFNIFWRMAIVFGLLLNGYSITALMIIVYILTLLAFGYSIRHDIQKAMNRIDDTQRNSEKMNQSTQWCLNLAVFDLYGIFFFILLEKADYIRLALS